MKRPATAIAQLLPVLALAACNGGQWVPSALLPVTGEGSTPPAAPSGAARIARTIFATPTSLARTRVELAPIVGATVQAVAPLANRLASRARESGFRLASANDPATTQVLKGYFSAFPEGGQTTVVYVWDVLDTAGNRLHRIQGQEKSPGAASRSNAWAGVAPETMETIADRTIAELTAYLAKPAG